MHPVQKSRANVATHRMHATCKVQWRLTSWYFDRNGTMCSLSFSLPPLAASICSSSSSVPISSRAFWYLVSASPFCTSVTCRQKKKEHHKVKECLQSDDIRYSWKCCGLDLLMPRQWFCSQGMSTLESGPGWCNCNLLSSLPDCQISWEWTGFWISLDKTPRNWIKISC